MDIYDNFAEGTMVAAADIDSSSLSPDSAAAQAAGTAPGGETGAALRPPLRRGRPGSTKRKATIEKHLLSQWGWGSSTTSTTTDGTGSPDVRPAKPASKLPKEQQRSLSAKELSSFVGSPAGKVARGGADAASAAPDTSRAAPAAPPQQPPSAAGGRPVRATRRDAPVPDRPERTAPPKVEGVDVDVYVAYHPSDVDAARALGAAVEQHMTRADGTPATAFVDVVSIAHLRISENKWRKKAVAERLARLQGAGVVVCLVSADALKDFRLAHTTESLLLWEMEMALQAGRPIVPILLVSDPINIAAFSRQPPYHPLANVNPWKTTTQLLNRPYLRPRMDLATDMDRVVSELEKRLQGHRLNGDGAVEAAVIDDESAVPAIEAADDSSGGGDGASQPHKPPLERTQQTPAPPTGNSHTASQGGQEEDDDEEDDLENWGHWQLDRGQITRAEKIGEGEFGEVIRGRLHGTGKHEGMVAHVAIKVQTKGSRIEFLREARIMVQLHHGNLVNIYGVCTLDEPVLIVSELCGHGSLKAFLQTYRASSLTVEELKVMMHQVCSAMAYIAGEGIIHRDLAARNVLIEDPLKCKVADFGMATEPGPDGIFHGDRRQPVPIRWSAPEAILYGRFSFKSDVWAYGIVLYEMVTFGNEVYGKTSNKEVVRMVCKENTRLPCPTKPRAKLGCTKELHDVMLACWEHDPEDRPTFRELLETHLPAAGVTAS
eukprot:m.186040 g.186040  ORF g.186040 m.186040 type:complete len:717 (+) comp16636_c0_seq1:87-2237(+)